MTTSSGPFAKMPGASGTRAVLKRIPFLFCSQRFRLSEPTRPAPEVSRLRRSRPEVPRRWPRPAPEVPQEGAATQDDRSSRTQSPGRRSALASTTSSATSAWPARALLPPDCPRFPCTAHLTPTAWPLTSRPSARTRRPSTRLRWVAPKNFDPASWPLTQSPRNRFSSAYSAAFLGLTHSGVWPSMSYLMRISRINKLLSPVLRTFPLPKPIPASQRFARQHTHSGIRSGSKG